MTISVLVHPALLWPAGRPSTISVLSPDPVVRAGLRSLLEEAPAVGSHEANSTVLDQMVRSTARSRTFYDVCLIDAKCVGPQWVAEFGAAVAKPSQMVVVLARAEEPWLTDRALDLGANGCLSLRSTRAELHAAVTAARLGTLSEPGGALGPDYLLNPHPAALTAQIETLGSRQIEILALVARGSTNEEIASALFLSPNSVKTHIRIAYRHIGATTRIQAALWGIENRVSDIARRQAHPTSTLRRSSNRLLYAVS